MKNSKFDKLFNTIMESVAPEGSEVYANKYNDEQRQAVIDVMNKYHFKFNDTDINLLCSEMYDDRGFYPDHVRRLTQDQFASIVKNMRSDWYENHDEPIAEAIDDQDDEQAYEDIDYDQCFETVQQIILANKDKADKLRSELNWFFENLDEYIWENIFEGDGFNWLGLKNPKVYDEVGFTLTGDQRKLLQTWTGEVDSGAFGDWDEWCTESAQDVFEAVGWGDLVELANKGWSYEDDGQFAESVKSSKKKKVIKEAVNKIDYKNIFNTMKEIFKANKDAFGKLKLFLKKRVSDYPEGFYEWAFVGMPDEKFTGLKDVTNWKQFGFKLTKEQEQVLKDFNNQYDEEFGDALENRIFSFFNKAGLSEINDIYNRRMNDDWDDQEEIENQSVLQESEGYDSSVEVDDDIDSIINYWSCDVKIVEEGKRGYTRSKLKKFASEFYNIGVYGEEDVTDLNDTMNGEYGTPKYAPTIGYDKYVFVILLPNGALQVEDSEGVHDFRNHEQAKKYVIQQCKTEGVAGMEEEQDESVTESKKVNTKKKIIKQSKKVTKKKKVVKKSKKN